MINMNQVYKCEVCGNIVEVLHTGEGELVCCGQPMKLMSAKKEEEGTEKHLPFKEESVIKIGEVEHPMEEGHYIEWIEIAMADGKRAKKFLKPGDKPEISCPGGKGAISARAYCNIHGLWEQNF